MFLKLWREFVKIIKIRKELKCLIKLYDENSDVWINKDFELTIYNNFERLVWEKIDN